ncbi:MAG: radical SAM/SPASM domain-containing protein [Bacteroidota bacterium]
MSRMSARPLNALLAGYSYLLSSMTGRPAAFGLPPAIGVELTNHCNLACPECTTGSGKMKRMKGFMDLSLFDKLISELKNSIYYVTLNFQGESTMHPKFFSFLIKSRRLKTVLSTNGHFLTPEYAEKIVRSGLNKLIVSLDGMEQETYSEYRRGGDLKTVLEGIRNVHDANRRAGRPLRLEIQFLVSRINEHQIESVKHFASEMKAAFRLKSMQIINAGNMRKWIPSEQDHSRYEEEPGGYRIKNRFPDRCARLWLNPVVTWDGKVLPCCFDKDADHVLGDLYEDTFRDIWNGPKYTIFRKSLLAGRYMTDICRNCTSGMRKVVI